MAGEKENSSAFSLWLTSCRSKYIIMNRHLAAYPCYRGDRMYIVIHGKKLLTVALVLLLVFAAVFLHNQLATAEIAAMAEQIPILIIDAGHGGADGGASTEDGVLESDINLAIAGKLNALAHLYGVNTVMTRETAEIDYPAEADTIAKQKVYDQKNRVALINSYPEGILISIHQNFYPDSRPMGAQVLYGHTTEGEAFGKLLHENLVTTLDPDNRRVASPIDDNIYLMRNAMCTAVLVECGFLSNPQEAALLNSTAYQNKISVVLLASYLEYIGSDVI